MNPMQIPVYLNYLHAHCTHMQIHFEQFLDWLPSTHQLPFKAEVVPKTLCPIANSLNPQRMQCPGTHTFPHPTHTPFTNWTLIPFLFLLTNPITPTTFAQTHQPYYCKSIRHIPANSTDPFEEWIQQRARLYYEATRAETMPVVYFPIVFHVLYRNDNERVYTGDILQQLQILNESFRHSNPTDHNKILPDFRHLAADSRIEFCLASTDPAGQPTIGINYKQVSNCFPDANLSAIKNTAQGGISPWDPTRYINVWIAPFCDTNLLGYATFPDDTTEPPGVVLGIARLNKNPKTIVHEMGHFFALRHIWGDTYLSCEEDDGVEDTPPCVAPNYGCPPVQSCNTRRMHQNYMDYTRDSCMHLFTEGQVARMWAALDYYRTQRGILLESNGCAQAHCPSPDLAILSVDIPIQDCNYQLDTLKATLINKGLDTAHGFSIKLYLDNQLIEEKFSTRTLAPGEKLHLTWMHNAQYILYYGPGLHHLTLRIDPAPTQEDQCPNNNEYTLAFTAPLACSHTETFNEHRVPGPYIQLTPNIRIQEANNYEYGHTWGRTPIFPGASDTGAAIYLYWGLPNDTNSGTRYFQLPYISLTGATSATLEFDLSAYIINSGGTIGLGCTLGSDTLYIQVSTNCGQSWQTIYQKGGLQLATYTISDSNNYGRLLLPDPDRWSHETLDLTPYVNQTIAIRFGVKQKLCALIFIDNIRIRSQNCQPVTGTSTDALMPTTSSTSPWQIVHLGTQATFQWTDNEPNHNEWIIQAYLPEGRLWLQQRIPAHQNSFALPLPPALLFVRIQNLQSGKSWTYKIPCQQCLH